MFLSSFPDRAAFRAALANANVVPVGVRILADTETPVSVLARFEPTSDALFLFESAEGGERKASETGSWISTYLCPSAAICG